MRKIKEISADTLTPISVYLRLKGKNKVILESIPRENDQSRFSIIALNPVKHIKFTDGNLTINLSVRKYGRKIGFALYERCNWLCWI